MPLLDIHVRPINSDSYIESPTGLVLVSYRAKQQVTREYA